MALTIVAGSLDHQDAGSVLKKVCKIAFDNSYPTGGESYTALLPLVGLTVCDRIEINNEKGYVFEVDYDNSKIKVFETPAITPAGTNTAPAFTGTTPLRSLNLATPAFSGTGFSTAGQVITTTDNQTMSAVDTAAGMWFIPTGSPAKVPCLILSNTIVAGAPAVLTCQGVPPTTDAGTYKIVTGMAPVGTVAAPVFSGTPVLKVGLSEVGNTDSLAALTAVEIAFFGR